MRITTPVLTKHKGLEDYHTESGLWVCWEEAKRWTEAEKIQFEIFDTPQPGTIPVRFEIDEYDILYIWVDNDPVLTGVYRELEQFIRRSFLGSSKTVYVGVIECSSTTTEDSPSSAIHEPPATQPQKPCDELDSSTPGTTIK